MAFFLVGGGLFVLFFFFEGWVISKCFKSKCFKIIFLKILSYRGTMLIKNLLIKLSIVGYASSVQKM